jgi:hypothetical protein
MKLPKGSFYPLRAGVAVVVGVSGVEALAGASTMVIDTGVPHSTIIRITKLTPTIG